MVTTFSTWRPIKLYRWYLMPTVIEIDNTCVGTVVLNRAINSKGIAHIEVDIEGGEAQEEPEMDLDAAVDDMAAADELDDDALADEEEAIMEALRGINYIPGKKEIVNEVAKRVARRLLEAKKANTQMQKALGNAKTSSRKK